MSDNIEIRVCRKCNCEKSDKEFGQTHRTCKICKDIQNNRIIEALKSKNLEIIKSCYNCNKTKNYLEFNNCLWGKFGKSSVCKECEKIISRKYKSRYLETNKSLEIREIRCELCLENKNTGDFIKKSTTIRGYSKV